MADIDSEKNARKKRLSKEQMMMLINCRIKNDGLLKGKSRRGQSHKAWETIRKELQFDVMYTAQYLRKVWANLIQKYKELKDPPTGTGTSNGEDSAISWPYYSILHDFLGERHNITPPFVLGSDNMVDVEINSIEDVPSLNDVVVVNSSPRSTTIQARSRSNIRGTQERTPTSSASESDVNRSNTRQGRTTLSTVLQYMKQRDKQNRKYDKQIMTILSRSLLNEVPYFSSSDSDD